MTAPGYTLSDVNNKTFTIAVRRIVAIEWGDLLTKATCTLHVDGLDPIRLHYDEAEELYARYMCKDWTERVNSDA